MTGTMTQTAVMQGGEIAPIPGPPPNWSEYDEVATVGIGGMGVVYRARNRHLNRVEALKFIRTGSSADFRDLARFRFEAEATAGLDHPNIVPVYAVGEADGRPYFAMKWIDGGDLRSKAASLQSDPVAMARMMVKIARAVHHAHRRGILHRDLKPSNILIDADGEPHVSDFGLAKSVTGEDPARTGLTVSGALIGSPSYMAPEQARGDRRVTLAADVYGLGAILYEMLTGQPPFVGPSITDVIRQVVAEPPVPPRALQSVTDRDLEAICLKCLEKDPQNRYPSAEALAADLDRRIAGRPIQARPAGMGDWVRQIVRRRPEFRKGYAWEVKLWFGVLMAAVQPIVMGLVLAQVSIVWIWMLFSAAWVGQLAILHKYMGARFTRLPETEKHSFLIAVGHVVAQGILCLAYVPITGPADGALAMYPAQMVAAGLALFVVGTTHWGRFFFIGLAVMAMAPLLSLWPMASPLIFGAVISGCMLYWAYAVKVTFADAPGVAGPLESL